MNKGPENLTNFRIEGGRIVFGDRQIGSEQPWTPRRAHKTRVNVTSAQELEAAAIRRAQDADVVDSEPTEDEAVVVRRSLGRKRLPNGSFADETTVMSQEFDRETGTA